MARSRRKDVRVLLVGEPGVGKTSLIVALVTEEFPEIVPPRADEITIPPEVTPENVNTQIVDYSAREQTEEELYEEIRKANVICVVYAVDNDESIDRIKDYWLPTIRNQLGEQHSIPIVLVGNKVEMHEFSTLDSIVPIMNQYCEIETCVECSAKTLSNISELFFYAQKAVLHPTAPLYSSESKYLTDKCQKALARIFKLCDEDNDGILNDQELNRFQLRCFNSPLHDAALEDVKNIVKRSVPDGVFDDGLTLSGFQFLHTLFIQRGRDETTWSVLRKFGYNDTVELDDDYLHPDFKIPEGCTVELSTLGIQFLTQLFHKHDLDRDNALSPNELEKLFNVCPFIPELFLNDSIQNYVSPEDKGYVKLHAFISLWTLTTLVNPKLTLEFLAYLGYIKPPEEHQLTAIHVTRDKRVDLQKRQTSRNVFTCHLIGPQGAGKSSFMKGFLGKNLQDQVQYNFALKVGTPNYVINTLPIYSQEKYLIMREVDIFHLSDKLSEPELFCDVICLMYDSSNPKSFEYVARIFLKHFVNCKLPILIVAAKSDEQQVVQEYSLQPDEFCTKYNLPKVHPFSATEIKQDVYIKLCTMAAYPNLGRLVHLLFMRPSSSWVSNHFGTISNVLNVENSTVIKTGLGVATLAMFGFLVVRYVNANSSLSSK